MDETKSAGESVSLNRDGRWVRRQSISTAEVAARCPVPPAVDLVPLLRPRDSWAYHALGAGFAQTSAQQTTSEKRNGMTSGKKPSLRSLFISVVCLLLARVFVLQGLFLHSLWLRHLIHPRSHVEWTLDPRCKWRYLTPG
ncbi:hypothetical protein BJX63DRAFT_405986 [Aspergillus granulosus]|uniref:Uncharacterized protein n=1 Tax=Aspergillus granulosus TaxID=176169 RepID=A0ABR4H1J2_9EURO